MGNGRPVVAHLLMGVVTMRALLAGPAVPNGSLRAAEPLVDFSIFKSFYRAEVTVRWEPQVPADQMAHYRLARSSTPPTSGRWGPCSGRASQLRCAARGSLGFNTTPLPGGRYAIDMQLIGPDDRIAHARGPVLPLLDDPQVKSRLVTVRPSDNMLTSRSGKPFFPIGIYESPGHRGLHAQARGRGLQPVPRARRRLADAADVAGPRCSPWHEGAWISASAMLDFSKDADKKREQLTEMVRLVGQPPRPALLGEHGRAGLGQAERPTRYYDGYCFLRALDQQHPIWTNHAPRNTIAELAHFNRATDIGGLDIYPVPEPQTHSDLPNKTISVVGDETDKNIATVNGEKPIFMVLQGFGWAELSAPDPASTRRVMPTFDQSRFMAYDAIVHGANGILYWGTHYTEKPSRSGRELRSLVSELAALQDVLASEAVRGKTADGSQAKAPGVRLLHKRARRVQLPDHRQREARPDRGDARTARG